MLNTASVSVLVASTPSQYDHGVTPSAQDYDPHAFPPFAVATDIVVFTIRAQRLQVVLVQRNEDPYRLAWALPGGFVRPDEDLEQAARRELAEETRIETAPDFLTQLGAYGDPTRDPRMRVVSVAWWAVVADLPEPEAGGDALYADVLPVTDVLSGRMSLAFDHAKILNDALEALRSALEETTLATTFQSGPFRISDLRRVYEVVWGTELDPGNFQRKVRQTPGWLADTGETAVGKGGRPASLFTGPDEVTALDRPVRRS